LLKAAGRLAVTLGWADSRTAASAESVQWLERAYASNTTDFEIQYYLGSALASAGRFADAERYLESSQRFRSTRLAAALELARVRAREGKQEAAIKHLQELAMESPRATVPRALEVSLLRRAGRLEEARKRAEEIQAVDPTSSVIRYELTRLGKPDPDLWTHLAADSNRVLDIVDRYLLMGAWDDALDVLAREYRGVSPPLREPGAVPPDQSSLVAYYRGYVRAQSGASPSADFETARSLPTTYVFPSRRSSYAVLNEALRANPSDGTARFLLGSLYLSSGLVEPAIESWQEVRRLRPDTPVLHRNLGVALLQRSEYSEARTVLQEGVGLDRDNVEVYLALDAVLSASGASARDRATALARYPSSDSAKPASLVFKSALALAEAGDAAAAERLFHDRFFPREEGGTSLRTLYAQVRLTSARVASEEHHCDIARQILDSLPVEQAGLAFSKGGLADVIATPTLSLQAGAIESACGRSVEARQRWERLAHPLSADGPPLTLAIADTARQRLGRPRTPAERARLEHAVENAAATLESAATSSPGVIEYARGILLQALGKNDEAREALRRVFTYPDRGLSHALARAALQQH
jgi:tetratricopeptide (TPR) repeat protein